MYFPRAEAEGQKRCTVSGSEALRLSTRRGRNDSESLGQVGWFASQSAMHLFRRSKVRDEDTSLYGVRVLINSAAGLSVSFSARNTFLSHKEVERKLREES